MKNKIYRSVSVEDRLPQFKYGSYRSYFYTDKGLIYYDKYDGWEKSISVEWWLEEVKFPTMEDVENSTHPEAYLMSFRNGANFILNHIKK